MNRKKGTIAITRRSGPITDPAVISDMVGALFGDTKPTSMTPQEFRASIAERTKGVSVSRMIMEAR